METEIYWHAIIYVETKSENNLREHWGKKNSRHKKQESEIKKQWLKDKPTITLPCKITLTRISPRSLDEDNLIGGALKHVRDIVADLIIPGKAKGRADSDPRLTWIYSQEKGKMAVKIIIQSHA